MKPTPLAATLRFFPGSDWLPPLLLQHAVLSGRVSPQGSLSAAFTGIQAVLQIAHDIAGGMSYLHARGVLHGVSGACRAAGDPAPCPAAGPAFRLSAPPL